VRCDRLWAEGKPHVYNPYEKESTKPRKKKLSKREWREMLDRRDPEELRAYLKALKADQGRELLERVERERQCEA